MTHRDEVENAIVEAVRAATKRMAGQITDPETYTLVVLRAKVDAMHAALVGLAGAVDEVEAAVVDE